MIVRKLRLKRGWTQSQLAEITGLTTRTIQRIERGHRPSLESCKSLASVFEVDLSLLQPEDIEMNNDSELKLDEQLALNYAKRVKEFYDALIAYISIAITFIVVFGVIFSVVFNGIHIPKIVYYVCGGVFAGVGAGIIIQGLLAFEVFGFLGPGWERKIAEKKLGRKL